MGKIFLGIIYMALLIFNLLGFGSCMGGQKKYDSKNHESIFVANNENVDQWFLDKYSKELLSNEPFNVRYFECLRLVNQETKDKVRHISIQRHDAIIDPSKLLEFTNLERLRILGQEIESLAVFSELKNLKFLYISNYNGQDRNRNRRYDFNDLSGLTKLEYINFDLYVGTVEIDLSGIENLTKLEALLFLYPYKVINIGNISTLTELTHLSLYLDYENISFLENKTKLKELILMNYTGYDAYNDQRIKKDYYLTIDFQAIEESSLLERIWLYGFTIDNIEIINKLHNLEDVMIIDSYLNPDNYYDVITNRDRINLITRHSEGR